MSVRRRMCIEAYLTLHTKLRFKWVKEANVKPDTLSLIEKKWEKALNFGTGEIFPEQNIMAQALRSRMNTWGHRNEKLL